MIIGVSGKANSGKNIFSEYITELDGRFELKSFADNVKRICAILTGHEDQYSREGKGCYLEEWGVTAGRMQQIIGTDAIRNQVNKDAWVISLFSKYNTDSFWIISDVRFPNEVQYIKKLGGIVVRINRDTTDDCTRDMQHESETSLDCFREWDFVIDNNAGLDALKSYAEYIYRRAIQDVQS